MNKRTVLFSLIFAIFIGFALPACGGGDSDPQPTTDGGAAADGVNPSADSDPNAPECYLDPDKVLAFHTGGDRYECPGKIVLKVYNEMEWIKGGATEPDALLTLNFRDYNWEMKSSGAGHFFFKVCTSLTTLGTLSRAVALSVSKAGCRTKTIQKELIEK